LAKTLCAAVVLCESTVAYAQDTLLTVRDTVTQAEIHLSDRDLSALKQQKILTSSPWTTGVNTFTGPSLKEVVELWGTLENVAEIHLMSFDNYQIDIPKDLVDDTQPIVASRFNGQAYSLRQKGPLWIMFPFDESDDMQTGLYQSRAVWHLTTIEITPK
jgi:hypothetical protein